MLVELVYEALSVRGQQVVRLLIQPQFWVSPVDVEQVRCSLDLKFSFDSLFPVGSVGAVCEHHRTVVTFTG